jgi:hypothetical protein
VRVPPDLEVLATTYVPLADWLCDGVALTAHGAELFHLARMFPAKAGIQPRGCGVRIISPKRASILELRQSTDNHDPESPRAVWPPTLNRGLEHVHQRRCVACTLRDDQIAIDRDRFVTLAEVALELLRAGFGEAAC